METVFKHLSSDVLDDIEDKDEQQEGIKPHSTYQAECPHCGKLVEWWQWDKTKIIKQDKSNAFTSAITRIGSDSEAKQNNQFLNVCTCDCHLKEYTEEQRIKQLHSRMVRLFGRANIPTDYLSYSYKTYNTKDTNQIIKIKRIKGFLDDSQSKILTIFGNSYTGKTVMSTIIMRDYMKKYKHQARIIMAKSYYDELRSGITDFELDKNKVKSFYQNIGLLVIDDLLNESPKWVKEAVFDIVDYRANRDRLTIITSNIAFFEYDNFPSQKAKDPIIHRIYQRLNKKGTFVYFNWDSIV